MTRPGAGRGRAAGLARKVAFLSRASHYPHRPSRVTTIETHFAWVFLAGRYAYKLKKPARQAGMDYRSLAARERGCREEVRLNRRLAPSVYLGVVPLTTVRGRLSLGGRGRAVDFLVKMRRLPAAAMLDRALLRRAPRIAGLEPLIALLADFYARARAEPFTARRYLARFAKQIDRNLAALRPARDRIDWARAVRIAGLQQDFLRRARRMVGARGRRVVEAHGDLRSEHVCLEPLAVIDCLEFDHRLRRLDPHEDVALLALEIERRRPALARVFLRRLAARMGDPVPACLTHIYMSHRALTRAKLAAWHLDDPLIPDPAPWIAKTDTYCRIAERHVRRALRLA
jgi:aminoglycoside phosphotransferase family enzyme